MISLILCILLYNRESLNESVMLTNRIQVNPSGQYWIGLQKTIPSAKSPSDTETYWLDGNPSTYKTLVEVDSSDCSCLRLLKRSGSGLIRWNDQSCGNSYGYICKMSGTLTTASECDRVVYLLLINTGNCDTFSVCTAYCNSLNNSALFCA